MSRHTRACPLVPPTLSSRRWRQRSRRWWRRRWRRWWRRRHTAFLCSLSSRSSDGAASSGARPFPGLPPFASLRRSPRPPPSGPTFPFATLDAPRRPTTSLATARPSSETSAPLHRRFPPPRRPPAPAAPPAAPPASGVSLPPATDASLLLLRDLSFLVARRASSSFSVDSHGPASVSTILSLRFTRDLSAFINSTGGERCIVVVVVVVVVVVEMLQRSDNGSRNRGYGRFLDSDESKRAGPNAVAYPRKSARVAYRLVPADRETLRAFSLDSSRNPDTPTPVSPGTLTRFRRFRGNPRIPVTAATFP